jgi:hypothetical protein
MGEGKHPARPRIREILTVADLLSGLGKPGHQVVGTVPLRRDAEHGIGAAAVLPH